MGPVRDEFAFHMLNDQGKVMAARIAMIFTDCLNDLEGTAGKDGRDMAIVRTKLQEAAFFAKRSIADDPKHQQDE
jgi:hypothetical protein